MGNRRPIFNNQNPLPSNQVGLIYRNLGFGLNETHRGIQVLEVSLFLFNVFPFGHVNLVHDDDIRRLCIHLAGVCKCAYKSCPEGIGYNNKEIRLEKRRLVVATIPDNDICFFLGLLQDKPIIDARVKGYAFVQQRLIFLSFLDGAIVFVHIIQCLVLLADLFLQFSICHGMPDNNGPFSFFHKDVCDSSGGCALPGTRPHCTDGHHRLLGPDHGFHLTHEVKVSP